MRDVFETDGARITSLVSGFEEACVTLGVEPAAGAVAIAAVGYTQLRSFSIMATGSAPTGVTLRWVTPASAMAATRSLM